MTPSQIQLSLVKERIENAAIKTGRQASDVTLIAVSKTFDIEDIIPLLESVYLAKTACRKHKGNGPNSASDIPVLNFI
jgi:hypothetical protein